MMQLHEELSRARHKRDDGWLSELVSLKYSDEPFNCIHTYLVVIRPGKVRAQHYHKKKEEWIAITSGSVSLCLRHVKSGQEVNILLEIDSDDYNVIYVPPLVAHALKNIGESEASVVVFSKTLPEPGDTIPFHF
jgi:oxalate decarboxylase/phosphoglucose isomerase-like protein (cupin superfamily)